jgi:hypothetical protein
MDSYDMDDVVLETNEVKETTHPGFREVEESTHSGLTELGIFGLALLAKVCPCDWPMFVGLCLSQFRILPF